MKKERQVRSNRGFSLIEILIVLAIVGIVLTGVVIAGTRGLAASRSTSAQNSLSSVASASNAYQHAWGGYPVTATIMGGAENSATVAAVPTLDEELETAFASGLDKGLVNGGFNMLYKSNPTTFTGSDGKTTVSTGFEVVASPLGTSMSGRSFCTDATGNYAVTGVLATNSGVSCIGDGFAPLQ